MSCDGHAKACADCLSGSKAGVAAVGSKDQGQKVLGHACPVVADSNAVLCHTLLGKTLHLDPDGSTLVRKLEGIGNQVIHDLGYAQRIPQDCLPALLHLEKKGLFFRSCLEKIGCKGVIEALPEVQGFVVQGKLALFHARNLKDVIDEILHLPPGKTDLFNAVTQFVHALVGVLPVGTPVVATFFPLSQPFQGKLTHAYDGIERSPHLVGDIAEEVLLGLFALPGHLQAVLQKLPLPLLLLLLVLYVTEAQNNLSWSQRVVKEQVHAGPAVDAIAHALEVPHKVANLLFHQLAHIGNRKVFQEKFHALGLEVANHHVAQIVVAAVFLQSGPGVGRALDHFVGIFFVVDAVNGSVVIAEHANGSNGALHEPPGTQFSPGKKDNGTHEQQYGYAQYAIEQIDIPDNV